MYGKRTLFKIIVSYAPPPIPTDSFDWFVYSDADCDPETGTGVFAYASTPQEAFDDVMRQLMELDDNA